MNGNDRRLQETSREVHVSWMERLQQRQKELEEQLKRFRPLQAELDEVNRLLNVYGDDR